MRFSSRAQWNYHDLTKGSPRRSKVEKVECFGNDTVSPIV